jgi:hypothetical protein
MYKKLLLFCALLPLAGQAQTVFRINQYNIVYRGDLMPVVTLFTNYQFNQKLSFTTYFYVNAYPKNSWGEGLFGLTYTPARWLSLGFLGGFQSNETELWRISPIILLNYKKLSFFGAFEFGGKRYRWDAMCFYNVKSFKFGGEFIRYYQMYAAGPRVEFSFLKKQPITIFYSGLWDWSYGNFASMFGIYTTFGAFRTVPVLDD